MYLYMYIYIRLIDLVGRVFATIYIYREREREKRNSLG